MLTALEEDRIRVAEIDAEIRDPECGTIKLASLHFEKFRVQERLESYKYPVLTLPNEIVSEIFVHFLPPYPACPPLTGIHAPTLLTHICRKWRQIALATPPLWRSIVSDGDISIERQAHIFCIWLGRTRCPLSIEIPGQYLSARHLSQVLSNFIPYRERWECLKLSDFPTSLLTSIKGPIPLLQDLFLELDATCSKVTFRDMPMLRRVTLNGYAALSVTLPWAQLTSLAFLRVHPSECSPILQRTSRLVHCTIDVRCDSQADYPGPDIELPYLESLTLEGVAPIGYLETFHAPALRSLKLPEKFLGPNPIISLASFVLKSGCKLQKVRSEDVRPVPEGSHHSALATVKLYFRGRDGSGVADDED
ncbi:F-box domain-containing protein [Mycena venus]|uniref:F-box domain-containing protein n=1 Tax=Mycena venus TaxID=2733690 RepID=A0A8H6YBS7_9AGAR|nr:F-box domain-containing protein [Mycena venus]